jgi:hypothetical protein
MRHNLRHKRKPLRERKNAFASRKGKIFFCIPTYAYLHGANQASCRIYIHTIGQCEIITPRFVICHTKRLEFQNGFAKRANIMGKFFFQNLKNI